MSDSLGGSDSVSPEDEGVVRGLGFLAEAKRTDIAPASLDNETTDRIRRFIEEINTRSHGTSGDYSYPISFSAMDDKLIRVYEKSSLGKITPAWNILDAGGEDRTYSYESLMSLEDDEESLVNYLGGGDSGESEHMYSALRDISSGGGGREMTAYDAVTLAKSYGESMETLLRGYGEDELERSTQGSTQRTSRVILSGNGDDENRGRKYAVIVGINKYSDRRGLHACVNDADFMEKVFQMYGYEVIKLTDETKKKPTKHNILEGALSEIELKKDCSKVIFFFSGHAATDDAGNFYLIPQDGNGDTSSYIAKKDLERYMENMDNLAVIIDACNSGAFNYHPREGQIVITSSQRDEPSNEEWFGHYSVFTYQLCNAINEESRQGGEALLGRCFEKARINTIQWSKARLLSQTPQITDMTDGGYSLS